MKLLPPAPGGALATRTTKISAAKVSPRSSKLLQIKTKVIAIDKITKNRFNLVKKEEDRKASIFEFEYTDIIGNIRNFGYRLDPSYEGTMLFFPSSLRHCVYPYYECDENRITVSGNIVYYSC